MKAQHSKLKVKIAIMSFSMLMMGAVGISTALAVIGAHFADVPQTKIQMLVSLTSLVILFSSLIAGKLQEYIAKKYIVILGCIFFVVGGVAPAFMTDFNVILVLRILFGFGVGFVQPMSSAVIEENFVGEERNRMMGLQTSLQMIGGALMNFACGELGEISWSYAFFPHFIALIPLVLVPFMLPAIKPDRFAKSEKEEQKKVKQKVHLTGESIAWIAAEFFAFLTAQANSIFNSYYLVEQGFGGSSLSGRLSVFSSVLGFFVGLFLNKICAKTKRFTFTLAMFTLLIGDFLIVSAKSAAWIWASRVFIGIGFATFLPVVVMNAAAAVDPYSKPMAISLTTCAKSLAQVVCPYVVSFFAVRLDAQKNLGAFKFMTYYLCILVPIAFIWALIQTIQDRKKQKAQ